MKLAIMQPYIFPYIGYFQLIHSVDKFVFFDDVNFIKQGWINRNRILLNDNIYTFAIPVEDISSYRLISETKISFKRDWGKKILKTLNQAYQKAPCYSIIMGILENIFSGNNVEFISELSKQSILKVNEYLDITAEIVYSSAVYMNSNLKGQTRIIDICRKETSDTYINAPGGTALYNPVDFKNENIELKFINPGQIVYKQFDDNVFIPDLSVIDVLMFNSKSEIKSMLNNYTLK
jgi:hypothetical protein